jgi:hypothetical protein
MPTIRYMILALGAAALAGCGNSTSPATCTQGTPVTADYTRQGSFKTVSLALGGVTVTGSDTVNVTLIGGLGVVGGAADNEVDGTEQLRFTVANGLVASKLSYTLSNAFNLNGDAHSGAATLEAFDHLGHSLGTKAINADAGLTYNVTALYGNTPLSAFTVTADVDGFEVGSLDYTPCQ